MLSKILKLSLLILCLFVPFLSNAQDEIKILPVYNPSHVQLKVSVNGKAVNDSKRVLYKNENEIEIKAYSVGNDSGADLVIPEIKVDLIRGGRLIATEEISEKGNISAMLEKAQTNDVIRFLVSGIYIKDALEKLELYSVGTVNLLYSIVEGKKLVMN
jgi:hypothetical protein